MLDFKRKFWVHFKLLNLRTYKACNNKALATPKLDKNTPLRGYYVKVDFRVIFEL